MTTPTLQFGQVQETAIGGRGVTFGDVDLRADFGESQKLAQSITRMVEHEAIKANDAVVDNHIAEVETETLSHLTKALQTRGKDAFNAEKSYMKEITSTLKRREEKLTNAYQKERFKTRTQAILGRSQNTLAKHQMNETARYGKAQIESLAQNLVQEGSIHFDSKDWFKQLDSRATGLALKRNLYEGWIKGSQENVDVLKVIKEKLENGQRAFLTKHEKEMLTQLEKNPQYQAYKNKIKGQVYYSAAMVSLQNDRVVRAENLKNAAVATGPDGKVYSLLTPNQLISLESQIGKKAEIQEVENYINENFPQIEDLTITPAEAEVFINERYQGKDNIDKRALAKSKFNSAYSKARANKNIQDAEYGRDLYNYAYEGGKPRSSAEFEKRFFGTYRDNKEQEEKYNKMLGSLRRREVSQKRTEIKKFRENSRKQYSIWKSSYEVNRNRLSQLYRERRVKEIQAFFDENKAELMPMLTSVDQAKLNADFNSLEVEIKNQPQVDLEKNNIQRQFLLVSGKGMDQIENVNKKSTTLGRQFVAFKFLMDQKIKVWKENNITEKNKFALVPEEKIKEFAVEIATEVTVPDMTLGFIDRDMPFYEAEYRGLTEDPSKKIQLELSDIKSKASREAVKSQRLIKEKWLKSKGVDLTSEQKLRYNYLLKFRMTREMAAFEQMLIKEAKRQKNNMKSYGTR